MSEMITLRGVNALQTKTTYRVTVLEGATEPTENPSASFDSLNYQTKRFLRQLGLNISAGKTVSAEVISLDQLDQHLDAAKITGRERLTIRIDMLSKGLARI